MRLSENLKGALHQAKEKATDFAGKHSDSIGTALDKVGETADKATKHKYSDRIDSGRAKAKSALDQLTEKEKENKPDDAA